MKKIISFLFIASMIVGMSLPALAFSTGYPNTYVNTGNQSLDIAGIAKTQVGYTETGDNHTKYNDWFYGYDKSDPWCAIFISWCAKEAGISTSVIAKNAAASNYSVEAGLYNTSLDKKSWGMDNNPFGTPAYSFYNHTPHTGDIIFVDTNNDNVSNHVGLVIDADDNYIYTVEGNAGKNSDKVVENRYSRSNGQQINSNNKIVFYAVPNYPSPQPVDPYVNLGDDFYAVILQRQAWIPLVLDDDNFVRLHTEQGRSRELWRFKRQEDGSYVILSAKTGKALEMYCGNNVEGTQIAACSEDWGGAYQRWYIYEQSNGYVIMSKHFSSENWVLDLRHDQKTDGTDVIIYPRNNSDVQIWAIYKGDEVRLGRPTLTVNTDNKHGTTKFEWNNVAGESDYHLKIWKNKAWEGDAYDIEWNTHSGVEVQLPPGTYEAYVDALNYFEIKNSDVVRFTVDYSYNIEPIPSTPQFLTKCSLNGHEYSLYASNYTWTQAKDYCQKQGGYLATITSEAESYVLDKLVSLYAGSYECVWLGGDNTSGDWEWVTGSSEPFTFIGDEHWGTGQPDGASGGNEHYLGYRYSSSQNCLKWNDFINAYENSSGFIMETRNDVSNTTLATAPKVRIKANTRVNGAVDSDYAVNPKISDDKRIESIALSLNGVDGGISYSAHLSDVGWTDFVNNGTIIGNSDGTSSIEAVKIKLTGSIADSYNVYYRTKVFGQSSWKGWAKNEEISGSIGGSLPITALEVVLVPIIRYHTHVADVDWTDASYDGHSSGTTGQEKQIEAMYFKLHDLNYGGIKYSTHSADIGWGAWRENGDWSGTTGIELQSEAFKIELTGNANSLYDVLYQAHVQDHDWMDWQKNGAIAGTVGESKRLEAIRAKVVPKGFVEGQKSYEELKQDTYEVSFDANEGTCSKTKASIAYQSVYNVIPLPTAEKAGYIFDGWYTAKDGGTKITDSSIFDQRKNITLYAHWKKIMPSTQTTVIKKPSYSLLDIAVSNAPMGTDVITAFYLNGRLADIQKEEYIGKDISVATTTKYDSVKVMLWTALVSLQPLCQPEEIVE